MNLHRLTTSLLLTQRFSLLFSLCFLASAIAATTSVQRWKLWRRTQQMGHFFHQLMSDTIHAKTTYYIILACNNAHTYIYIYINMYMYIYICIYIYIYICTIYTDGCNHAALSPGIGLVTSEIYCKWSLLSHTWPPWSKGDRISTSSSCQSINSRDLLMENHCTYPENIGVPVNVLVDPILRGNSSYKPWMCGLMRAKAWVRIDHCAICWNHNVGHSRGGGGF